MILLQKDHHPIRQHNALGLLRVKRMQWRNRNLLPCGVLRHGGRGEQCHEQEQRGEGSGLGDALSHCVPPCEPAAACGLIVSVIATVRFVSRNVWFATRRISALVTLSMRS